MKRFVKHLKLSVCLTILISSGFMSFAQMGYIDYMSSELKAYPVVQVNAERAEKAPKLDGILDEETWSSANVYSDFKVTRSRFLNTQRGSSAEGENETKFRVLYDDRFLYFGIECFDEDMSGLRTKSFLHDDRNNIMGDDRVEIFIDLDHDHQKAANLILSAGGATFDQMLERPIQYALSAIYKPEWNGKWHSKVKHYEDRWTAEIFVDINHMRRSEITKGQTFGLMVGRVRSDRSGPMTDKNWTIGKNSWNNPREEPDTGPVEKNTFDYEIWAEYFSFPLVADHTHNGASGYYEPIEYADLICSEENLLVKGLSFNEAYANYSGSIWQKPQFWGDNPLELTMSNKKADLLNLEISVETKGFKDNPLEIVQRLQLNPGEEKTVDLTIPVREDEFQPFRVEVRDTDKQQLLYNTTYVTRVPAFIEFDLEALYMPEDKEETIKCVSVIAGDGFDGLTAELDVFSRDGGQKIASDVIEDFEKVEQFTACLEDLDVNELSTGNYYIDCRLKDSEGNLIGEFEQGFTKRKYDGERTFHARKDNWEFGGVDGEAVIVEFPDQKDFVLWQPANYFGMWFLNNVGLTYECGECWGYASGSCNEPMQDKKILYQTADIVENTPARVVLRWTYGLTNNNYDIFFNEWVEEYFTIYPDGSGLRNITIWTNTDYPHEIIQPQYIFPNGVLPGQMLENVITRVFDLEGNVAENLLGSTGGETGYSKDWSEEILRMPLKNRVDPYMIIGKTEELMPELRISNLLFQSANSRDIRYNLGAHWPINPLEVDVFNIVSTAMPYHSWIGLSQVQPFKEFGPNEWIHFFGVTEKDDEYLKDIAASWLHPANISIKKGSYEFTGYTSKEYIYEFENTSSKPLKLDFTMTDTEREAIVHPAFRFSGYTGNSENIEVKLNGKMLSNEDFRSGVVESASGNELILWIGRILKEGDRLQIKE